MKKERLLTTTLFTGYVLALLLGVSGFVINNDNQEVVRHDSTNVAFKSYFKEPLVIEKEVVVYVDKEVESAMVAEPEPYIQTISSNFDVFTPTNLNEDQLKKVLGDKRSGLHSIIDAVIEAEQVHGVNAIYLLATLGLESGWGKYESADNNIAGWKNPSTGGFRNFGSRYDCVLTVAEGLSTSFIETHGRTLAGVTSRYCPEDTYLGRIMQIMSELQNNLY